MVGQRLYHALLLILFVIGLAIAIATGSLEIAVGAFLLVIGVRVIVGIVNVVCTAFLGRPLVYDMKTVGDKKGGDLGGDI